MFDSFNVRAVTERVTQNVNVTEKRAPTDESVRLLREMERAAEAQILSAIRLENCPVDAVLHRMRSEQAMVDLYRIVYKIAGERRVVEYEDRDMHTSDLQAREVVAIGLRDALAKDIANVLTASMLKAMRP